MSARLFGPLSKFWHPQFRDKWVRAWAPSYPDGRVFPTPTSFAKERRSDAVTMRRRLEGERQPVPDRARRDGLQVPEGLETCYLNMAYFLPESEYQKFLASTPAPQ